MTIRILLAVPPPLFETLEEAIAATTDFAVAGAAMAPLDVLLAVGTGRADVVIVSADGRGEPPGIVTHLLAEYPDVKVIGVAARAVPANLYFFQLRQVPVADASPAGLLNALRALADE